MKTVLKICWAGFVLAVILVTVRFMGTRSPEPEQVPTSAPAMVQETVPTPSPSPSPYGGPAPSPTSITLQTSSEEHRLEPPPSMERPAAARATSGGASGGRDTETEPRKEATPPTQEARSSPDRRLSRTTHPTPAPPSGQDGGEAFSDPGPLEPEPLEAGVQTGVPLEDALEPEPSDSDSDPPYLYAIWFEPPRIVDGEIATALAEVEDDISGVKSVMGSLRSPSGKSFQTFYCRRDAGTGVFRGAIKIPKDAESGQWRIGTLSVKDKANNLYTYVNGTDGEISDVYLEVESSTSDSAPPELTGVTVPTAPLKDGETFTITLEATDDFSGVKSLWGSFRNPSKTATVGFTGRPTDAPGIYTATVPLPKNAEDGEWRVKYLQVTDEAGNRRSYQEQDPALSNAFVLVSSVNSDSTPPELKSISLDPRTIQQSGTIEVTVEVSDDQSGPKSVLGWARNPALTARLIFTCKQEDETSRFVGTLIVPENAQVGEWFIDTLHLYDNAGNLRHYLAPRDPELDDATFTVE